ncbi:MAG: heavy metal translocating P-type ATPase [Clostridia bacterium]|nr:heavy metal translocating P-type ATPase [Clostridia bacterium]
MKKQYPIVGLDCAVCAAKLAAAIERLNGISSASIDFLAETLNVEYEEGADEQAIFARIVQVAAITNPEATVGEGAVRASSFQKKTPRHVHIEHELPIADGAEAKKAEKEREKKSGFKERLQALPFWLMPVIQMAISSVFLVLALCIRKPTWLNLVLFAFAYLPVGLPVLVKALRNILHGQVFDENFLMAIASVGASVMGEYTEAVAVMLLYTLGEFFSDFAVKRSRKSINSLMEILPDEVNLLVGERIQRVDARTVGEGECVLVRAGERIPLDGVVVEGSSQIDASALTGESLPLEVTEGDSVLSGCINLNGAITVEVTAEFEKSTATRILELVQSASAQKAKAEGFITKFARVYTPIVVALALMVAFVPLLFGGDLSVWGYRALSFLVISCPCALVISVPLTYFGGVGAAARKGVLVKGGSVLESLYGVKQMVFDKTGTLTTGKMQVVKIVPCDSISTEGLLQYAGGAEMLSTHPIAKCIVEKANAVPDYPYYLTEDRRYPHNVRELAGFGVIAEVNKRRVTVGSRALLAEEGISFPEVNAVGSVVFVAIDGAYAGYIVVADTVKKDSASTVKRLKKAGIRTVMLTGDKKRVAEAIANEIGIDEVYAELLPEDKVQKLMECKQGAKGLLAFVGDGINDAPALAAADVGVSMGSMGADAAIEASDTVLMTDEVAKLCDVIGIAAKTRRIVVQNIVFSLAVKALAMLLSALGLIGMWIAIFADVGVSILAVLNAMRMLSNRK